MKEDKFRYITVDEFFRNSRPTTIEEDVRRILQEEARKEGLYVICHENLRGLGNKFFGFEGRGKL